MSETPPHAVILDPGTFFQEGLPWIQDSLRVWTGNAGLRYDRLDEAVRDFRRAAVAAATSATAAVPTATVPAAAAAARAAISGPAARRPGPRGEHRGADADLQTHALKPMGMFP